MWRIKACRFGIACCVALFPLVGSAATEGSQTVREFLAQEDRDIVGQFNELGKVAFAVSDATELDDDLRQAAQQIAREQVARLNALWPAWMAEERAASGDAALRGRVLFRRLYLRTINELAILRSPQL